MRPVNSLSYLLSAWLTVSLVSCQKEFPTQEPFKAEAIPVKTDIFDGGSIEIDLKANVSTIKVVSLKCDYPLSNETLGTLSTGAILDMESVNRCARFKSQAVSIPYNKEVLISLVLEDTQRDRSLHIDIELSLWNTPDVIPEKICIEEDNITLSCLEAISVPVHMEPPGAMGGFDFKIIKDEEEPYLEVEKDVENSLLLITGGERGGKAIVRVFSILRPSVYHDIEVFVRHRVVIIIDASFSRWYSNFLNGSLKYRSGNCDNLTATLAWWNGDLEYSDDKVDLDRIKFTQCYAKEIFQPFFYFECDRYSCQSEDIRNGVSPVKTDEGGFLADAPLCHAAKVNDLTSLYLGDGKNAPESQKYYMGKEMNTSSIDYYCDVGYKGKSQSVYRSFCLSVRKVLFEHPDNFDLKYVYHRYKQTAAGRYWWSSKDDSRQLFRMENGFLVSPYQST